MIKNYSGYFICCVDIMFGIDYGDDIDKVIGIILLIVDVDDWIMCDFELFVKVVNFGDSLVDIVMWNWVNVFDYWDVRFDLMKKVKEVFD